MYIMKDGGITHEIAVSDIDSVIFYKPSISDPEWVMINGVKWATRNVDKPGTFTAKPEDPGMFYRWNSKVGWSSTDPLTPSDGTSTWNNDWDGNGATAWEKANDPCPPGWRMPNADELESLLFNYNSVWTIVNGMRGCRFGSGSNTVFLPAAGVRNDYGTLIDPGSCGIYWSSTQSSDGNAYDLSFYSGGADAGTYESWDKTDGLSCRCVAE